MIAYCITFISFILDIFLSNYIPLFNGNKTFLIPMFTLTSLIVTMPFFKNNKRKYIVYSMVFGCLFDLCITSTFPLNVVLFMLIAFIIIFIDQKFSYNVFINIIKLFVIIFVYDGLTYCVLLIIGYFDYNIMNFIFKYLKSITLNIIYLILIHNLAEFISYKFKIKRAI